MKTVKQFVRESANGDYEVYHEYGVLPDIGLSVRLIEGYGCGTVITYPWHKYADIRKRVLQDFARIEIEIESLNTKGGN